MALPEVSLLLLTYAADDKVVPTVPWHAETFSMAVVATLVFGFIGIFLAVIGFKIFDWVTPGNLEKEILEKQNIAAAIIAAAVVIGICIVVARAIG